MAYDALYKEIIGLTDDKLKILIDYARFLKQGSSKEGQTERDSTRKNVREIGSLSDKFFYMAPDFDD